MLNGMRKVLSPRQPTVGMRLNTLTAEPRTWVHRRVERIEILAAGDCIRHQSIDFTLPRHLAIPGSGDKVLVPITLMKKGPLSRLDVTGPDGRPATVLESAANGPLAVEMLRAMAARFYGFSVGRESAIAVKLLNSIVLASEPSVEPSVSTKLIDQLDDALSAQPRQPSPKDDEDRAIFRSIATQFYCCFLMVVEVPPAVIGQRSLVKLSYRESRDDSHGQPRLPARWELQDFSMAASFHIELEAPPLLSIAKVYLTEQLGDSIVKTDVWNADEKPQRIVHLARRPSPLTVAELIVILVPRRDGVAAISFYSVHVVAAFFLMLIGARISRDMNLIFQANTPLASPSAAAMLVASGGLLLTWLSRTPEEWIVQRVLRSPRRDIVMDALLLLLAAFLIVLPVPEPVRSLLWYLLFAGSLYVVYSAHRSRRRSSSAASDEPTEIKRG